MQEFFENLKKKRQEKGIDLKQIAARSKLNLNILIAIENGEMESIPRGFRKIYLRRYMKEIGLNPDEWMKDYLMLVGDQDLETIREKNPEMVDIATGRFVNPLRKDRTQWYLKIFMGISAIALMIFIIIGLKALLSAGENSVEIAEVTVPTKLKLDSIETSQNNENLPIVKQTELQTGTINGRNTLIITAREKCWIRQIVDRRDTLEYTLEANQSKTVAFRDQVRIAAGRGDVLSLVINGKTYENLAPAGIPIRRLVVDKYGIAEKILSDPARKDTSATNLEEKLQIKKLPIQLP